MPKLSRPPILFNHNYDYYAALIELKQNSDKEITKVFHYCPQGQLYQYTGKMEAHGHTGQEWDMALKNTKANSTRSG